jgi:hypothetical protein
MISPGKRQRAAAKAARATPPQAERTDRPRKPSASTKQRRSAHVMGEPVGATNLRIY